MINGYYTYIYLDPRKSGSYSYGDYNFEFEPFYVGKGKGKRVKAHLWNCTLKRRGRKSSKVKSILSEGLKPVYLKLKENLTEQEALDFEASLVQLIGRADLNKGPLCNHVDRDSGGRNQIFSKETREKLSKANKGKTLSEEHKKKIGESNKGKISRKTVEAAKQYWLINKRLTNNRSVKMLDLEDNVLRIFDSCKEADRYMGFRYGTVNAQCKKLGKCRYKPLKFRYND
jgi:hypothetical protein